MDIAQAEVHIRNIIDNHIATVDEGMINFFKQEASKGTYSSYRNCQALALEYSLRQAGLLVTLPKVKGERYQWRHDWAYTPEILIDLKRRPSHYPNTSLSDPLKFLESYAMNQLTHFVTYITNKEDNLQIGDKLYFKFEDMIDVREALSISKTMVSKDGGTYMLFPNRYRKFGE